MPYKDVEIPKLPDDERAELIRQGEIEPDDDEKLPEDFHYTERRAYIFKRVIEAGHPDLVSRRGMARYFGVVPSTITRDVQAITDEVTDELGTDALFITEIIYRKVIRELIEDEEWDKLVRVTESYNDWLSDRGAVDTVPGQHQFEHTLDASQDYINMLSRGMGE